MPDEPDVTVELRRSVDDRGAVWSVRAAAHGVGYNNADVESEPQSLLWWLQSTVTFLMGRVAAEQGREEQENASNG